MWNNKKPTRMSGQRQHDNVWDYSTRNGKLLQCRPTAVRRGVSGSRVAQHLHLPITHGKQAETAVRERYDALIGKRTERIRDGLTRRRVVLCSAGGELDVAVDRDDASDSTQSEAVVRIRRFPLLGYGKLFGRPYALPQVMVADGQRPEHADSPIGMNQH